MYVTDTQVYTSPLYKRNTYAARSGMVEGQKTTSDTFQASAVNTSDATPRQKNTVTSTTGNNLSKEVMGQLIAAAQETGVSSTDTKAYDGPLSIGERHHLEDIANNPGYAASQANLFGIGGELVFVGKTLPTVNNGFTDAERAEFIAKQTAQMANLEQVQGKRSAYYESLTGQGVPPAEIFAKLLEFNANLPESHDATLGWSESGRAMSYSDYNKAQLDYLQNLINKG